MKIERRPICVRLFFFWRQCHQDWKCDGCGPRCVLEVGTAHIRVPVHYAKDSAPIVSVGPGLVCGVCLRQKRTLLAADGFEGSMLAAVQLSQISILKRKNQAPIRNGRRAVLNEAVFCLILCDFSFFQKLQV